MSANEKAGFAGAAEVDFLSFAAGAVAFCGAVAFEAAGVVAGVGFLVAALNAEKNVEGLLTTWLTRDLTDGIADRSPGRFRGTGLVFVPAFDPCAEGGLTFLAGAIIGSAIFGFFAAFPSAGARPTGCGAGRLPFFLLGSLIARRTHFRLFRACSRSINYLLYENLVLFICVFLHRIESFDQFSLVNELGGQSAHATN